MINEVKWHTTKIEHWKNNNIKYNTNNNDNKNNDTNKYNNNNNNNNNNYDNLFDQHIWALSFRDRHGYRLFDTSYPYKYSNLYPFCNPFKYSTQYLFSIALLPSLWCSFILEKCLFSVSLLYENNQHLKNDSKDGEGPL